jgi:hypothetical protein
MKSSALKSTPKFGIQIGSIITTPLNSLNFTIIGLIRPTGKTAEVIPLYHQNPIWYITGAFKRNAIDPGTFTERELRRSTELLIEWCNSYKNPC